MTSIFSGLITSKTRIKILMRLFLNPKQNAYLRELAEEFNASPSQVREELRHLDDAGFLDSHKNGRQIQYQANQKHPLFHELQSMVQKALGMDRILDSILERLGNLEEAYLIDDYAEGTTVVVQVETTQGTVFWESVDLTPGPTSTSLDVTVPDTVYDAAKERSAPTAVPVLSRAGRCGNHQRPPGRRSPWLCSGELVQHRE